MGHYLISPCNNYCVMCKTLKFKWLAVSHKATGSGHKIFNMNQCSQQSQQCLPYQSTPVFFPQLVLLYKFCTFTFPQLFTVCFVKVLIFYVHALFWFCSQFSLCQFYDHVWTMFGLFVLLLLKKTCICISLPISYNVYISAVVPGTLLWSHDFLALLLSDL